MRSRYYSVIHISVVRLLIQSVLATLPTQSPCTRAASGEGSKHQSHPSETYLRYLLAWIQRLLVPILAESTYENRSSLGQAFRPPLTRILSVATLMEISAEPARQSKCPSLPGSARLESSHRSTRLSISLVKSHGL